MDSLIIRSGSLFIGLYIGSIIGISTGILSHYIYKYSFFITIPTSYLLLIQQSCNSYYSKEISYIFKLGIHYGFIIMLPYH